jgi:ssDNA-binding Zn-finger/Zn-ribbon topoisomerase 1
MNQYTPKELQSFQMKDSRIIFQSVFSSLTNYYGQLHSVNEVDEIVKEALIIVEELKEKYPMQEILDEPQGFNQPKVTLNGPPSHCPECGADVKRKTGISKTGKSYDFTGCSAYPECKWIWKK